MIIPFVFPVIHDAENIHIWGRNPSETLHLLCKFIAIITAIIQFIVNKMCQAPEDRHPTFKHSFTIKNISIHPALINFLYFVIALLFFAYTNVTFIDDLAVPDLLSTELSYPFLAILSSLPFVISPSYIWSLSYVVIGFFGTYMLIDSMYYFFSYMMQKVEYQN